MSNPKQASWMVRQIMNASNTLQLVQIPSGPKHSVIRTIYLQLLPTMPRVPWKTLMFNNAARPKAQFTMSLHLQGRLQTVERLAK